MPLQNENAAVSPLASLPILDGNLVIPEAHSHLSRSNQAKIYDALHTRIPMVTADEQRALQVENAEADERIWSSLRDLYAGMAEGQKVLIRESRYGERGQHG